MPKVVVGGKASNVGSDQVTLLEAIQGKPPQNIPDKTNRAGAAEARAKAATPAPPVADKAEAPKAEPAEVDSEPGDEAFPDGVKKRLAKLTVRAKQADAVAQRLKTDLEDAENFTKAQYLRAQLAEEKSAALAKELESLKQQPAAAQAAGPQEPDPANFYDEKGNFKLADYTKAVSSFTAQKAVGEERARLETERRQAEEARLNDERATAMKAMQARLEDAKERYPDYEKVIAETPVVTHNAVLAYLQASDHIGDITYYLAKNPDFAEKLNKLHPLQAIAEIGRLEIRWQKDARPATSEPPVAARNNGAAPAPITPLPGLGTAGVISDPSKMTPAQLRDYDRERALSRRRR